VEASTAVGRKLQSFGFCDEIGEDGARDLGRGTRVQIKVFSIDEFMQNLKQDAIYA
jgi:hypothetical protein